MCKATPTLPPTISRHTHADTHTFPHTTGIKFSPKPPSVPHIWSCKWLEWDGRNTERIISCTHSWEAWRRRRFQTVAALWRGPSQDPDRATVRLKALCSARGGPLNNKHWGEKCLSEVEQDLSLGQANSYSEHPREQCVWRRFRRRSRKREALIKFSTEVGQWEAAVAPRPGHLQRCKENFI